jgi:Zn-dependent peptidase ImmA (M78 family)
MLKRLDKLELVEKVANFRSIHGYGASEPIHLKSFLVKNNVLTLFRPLSDTLAGMALKVEQHKFMMINDRHSLGRQHFTIAHELYHLFVQENFTSQKCITSQYEKSTDIEENKADFFASHLLLPEVGLIELIPNEERKKNHIKANTIFKIQQVYSVSVKAVIHRLVELEFVDRSFYDLYSTGLKQKAKSLGYDIRLLEAGNNNLTLGNYVDVANKLFEKQRISESYYLELLNTIGVDPFEKNQTEDECQ